MQGLEWVGTRCVSPGRTSPPRKSLRVRIVFLGPDAPVVDAVGVVTPWAWLWPPPWRALSRAPRFAPRLETMLGIRAPRIYKTCPKNPL
jgi:hypothetical protein